MINGIDAGASYRNRYTAGAFSTRETTGTPETEQTGGQSWDAVFTDKADNGVSVDDFLNLMVAQLQNQDFMNPVDDTQYVTQLAQFATMQQMQELATYMKTNYVMSLVGKEVTAARFSVSGELQKETGRVEKISLVNNEYAVYINGKKFSLQQIMELGASEDKTESSKISMDQLMSMLDREVTVRLKAQGEGEKDTTITGVVDRISTESGKYRVQIDGKWYSADDVVEIAGEAVPNKPTDPEKPEGTEKPEKPEGNGVGEKSGEKVWHKQKNVWEK